MKTFFKLLKYLFIVVSTLFVLFVIAISTPYVYHSNYIIFTDKSMQIIEKNKIKNFNVVVPNQYLLQRKEYDLIFKIWNMEFVEIILKTKNKKKLKFKENNIVSEKRPLLYLSLNYKTDDGLPEYTYDILKNRKNGIKGFIKALFKTKKQLIKEEYKKIKDKAHFISFDIVDENSQLVRREKIPFDIFIIDYNLDLELDLI